MRYGKAPIVEAILDIRVAPRPEASAAEIAAGFTDLAGMFPKREEIAAEQHLQIAFGPGGPGTVKVGPILGGFRYTDSEQRQIVQATRDGFVFSLLPPYDHWDDFMERAYPLWARYQSAWNPTRITRIALRYVNKFDFPGSENSFDYAENFTIMPSGLREDIFAPPQKLDGLSLQLMLPQADIEAMAIIHLGTLPRSPQTPLSVVLDIDLFREQIGIDPNDGAAILEVLEILRHRKNDLFRACLTEEREEALEPMEEEE